MRKHLVIAALALATALAAQTNQASASIDCDKQGCREVSARQGGPAEASHRRGHYRTARHSRSFGGTHHGRSLAQSGDPRPSAWCGWFLRRHLGIPRSAFPNSGYNLARAFASVGSPAGGPGDGVIAVWRHHVGLIKGGCDGRGCIVLSGNDGHAVRERYRSLRGVIAYRRWGNQVAEAR